MSDALAKITKLENYLIGKQQHLNRNSGNGFETDSWNNIVRCLNDLGEIRAALQHKQVDVEGLKEELCLKFYKGLSEPMKLLVYGFVNDAIDHLHQQGHLTAQPEWLPIESAPKKIPEGFMRVYSFKPVVPKNSRGFSLPRHNCFEQNYGLRECDLYIDIPTPTPPKQDGE